MTVLHRVLASALPILVASVAVSPALAQKRAGKNQVSDSVTATLPAFSSPLTFDEQVLITGDPLSLATGPYADALKDTLASQAGCLLPQQVLAIHFANWDSYGSAASFNLVANNWYFYHVSRKLGKAAAQAVAATPKGARPAPIAQCVVNQADLKSNDMPRLYGDKSAIFLGINVFTPRAKAGAAASPIPEPIPIVYKLSVSPETPANVQDLGALAAAVLGITLPAIAPALPGAPLPPPATLTYVAASRFKGYKRLPFDFNIIYSLAYATDPKTANAGAPAPVAGIPAPAAPPVPGSPAAPAAPPAPPPALPGAAPGGGGAPAAGATKTGSPSGTPASQSPSTSNTTAIDCSATNATNPCSFTRSFLSDDKEWWDFSVGVTTPGVREAKYNPANPAAPPTFTRHTELYGILDLYPFAKWAPKDSYVPHFNVGLPVSGKPFYLPYYGVAENVTARWRNFPLPLSVFIGLIDIKETFNLTPAGSGAVFVKGRELKGVWGVEVPVSTIVSKIPGIAKNASSGGGGGGGGKGNSQN
jgi:hypothetical protein